ncbi:MAG: DUF4981 domain-containing protein [Lentisphaeria bacterium]|nr:DUF4981 domain-containing protein [Lentisphaeria bacterium]
MNKKNNVSKNFWELPELIEINRLPMAAELMTFDTAENALSFDRTKSPYFKGINGTWDFILLDHPDDDYSNREWDKIKVPGVWTLQGFKDKPIYTNLVMPFDNNPPIVPTENPTGIYKTNLEIPESWQDRRIVLHIGGAESVLEVYCNGSFVGLSKDTRLPAEFDLTNYVETGANELICKVIRWSDASYIEDQDQWWNAGIYRDCYLYSTNKGGYINDIFANGDFDLNTREGILDIETNLGIAWNFKGDVIWGNRGPQNPFYVKYNLTDADNNVVYAETAKISHSYREQQYTAKTQKRIANINPWSSESPYLYKLTVELFDHEQNLIEAKALKVGFRNLVIKNQELLINGEAVLIRGVNRHEHDQYSCKTVSLETMLEDIKLLKKFNFNAVRNCHYPQDIKWYDLCDEYGIYLIDEANVEAHANYSSICRDSRFKKAFVDRNERMVLRTRSHVSIIEWSTCNETGFGDNHMAAIDAILKLDKSRIIHNEGECHEFWSQSPFNFKRYGNHEINATVNRMYPPIQQIIEIAQSKITDRPVILCEYNHAMGNSNGSLADYWDAFKSVHGLQGGFIWDWVDQGIVQETADGKKFWAYGGDFGEKIHDFDFCCNGLIWPDRTPHPAMYEFKHVAQHVNVDMIDCNTFYVNNDFNFSDLKNIKGTWELLVDGKAVESGELPELYTGAGTSQLVEIDYSTVAIKENERAHINFYFSYINAPAWCDENHVIASEQFEITDDFEVIENDDEIDLTKVVTTDNSISCNDICIEFDKNDGKVTISKANNLIIKDLAKLTTFRAPTDNDGIKGWTGQDKKAMGWWLAAQLDRLTEKLIDVKVLNISDSCAAISRTYQYSNEAGQKIDFLQEIILSGDGKIEVSQSINYDKTLPSLPRVGVMNITANGFENVTYWGLGPHENYIDRNRGAFYGCYSTTVKEMFEPYILPQENGNRTYVDKVILSNGNNSIIINYLSQPFEFGASHYSIEDIFAAKHPCELVEQEATYLSIDLAQRGLGTNSCGPATLPEYCLEAGEYNFSFEIEIQ